MGAPICFQVTVAAPAIVSGTGPAASSGTASRIERKRIG